MDTNSDAIAIDEEPKAVATSDRDESAQQSKPTFDDQAQESMSLVSSTPASSVQCHQSLNQHLLFQGGALIKSSTPNAAGCGMSPVFSLSSIISPSFPDMGSSAYSAAAARSPILVQGAHFEVRRTNSAFSDHFNVVEYFLYQKWTKTEGGLAGMDER